MTTLREVQRFEQFFWDKTGRETKVEDVHNVVDLVESNPWIGKLVDLLEDIRGKKVLDCGCGMGNLSVYSAMKGGYIEGFDISSEMVKIAHVNAKKNDTSGKCNFLYCSFEDLPYRDVSFDLAVGSYILHHVDVARAVKELHRFLRPGGRAIFIETWGKNPLLVWAGKYLAGRLGIAKYGTKYEHPITMGDIKKMRKIFSQVYLEFPEFIFFKKAATNVFRWKKNLRFIPGVLVKMDNFVTRRFPSFNKYGYYCVIRLVKGDDEKLTVRYR